MSPEPRSNIIPFGQPVDYELRSKFVSPLSPEELARIMGERVDLYAMFAQRPTFGEKLVAFFHRWQFRIGIGCYAVAVLAGMYFAFQVGRGVL